MALTTVQVQITWNTPDGRPVDLNQALDILSNWDGVELVLMNQGAEIIGSRKSAPERFAYPTDLGTLEVIASDFADGMDTGWGQLEDDTNPAEELLALAQAEPVAKVSTRAPKKAAN